MERSRKLLLLVVVISVIAPLVMILIMFSGTMDSLDLMIQTLLLAIMVPLIAISGYMWATGKGAMLIAGYNTSPKAVRDMYDSRAMTKFVGMLLMVFMAIMLVGVESLVLAESMVLFWVLLLASIGILISGLYYMNTGNRFLKEGANPSAAIMTADDRKRNRNVLIAGSIFTIIILIVVFAFVGSGSVSASLETDGLHVGAPLVNALIPYEDVTAIELREGFDAGHRVGGFGGSKVSSGNFDNGEFGRYVLAKYNTVQSCIVVHHSGGVLVFNLETTEKTTRLYDEMQSKL